MEDPKQGIPRLVGTIQKKYKNACGSEITLVATAVYISRSSDINTNRNGCVQESATDSSLKSRKPVTQGIVRIPRPRGIRLTIDHKATKSSQDVKVSTRLSPVHAIVLSDRSLTSTPLHSEQSSKRVKETSNTFPKQMVITSHDRQVDTSTFLYAVSRPIGIFKTPKGNDRSHNVIGKVANKSKLPDHQVDEQAPNKEV